MVLNKICAIVLILIPVTTGDLKKWTVLLSSWLTLTTTTKMKNKYLQALASFLQLNVVQFQPTHPECSNIKHQRPDLIHRHRSDCRCLVSSTAE